MNGARAVARGCGRRVAGGIYAEVGLAADGLPLEAFLMDPPVEIPATLQLAPQGVAWVERQGVWHLVDWVGSQHYPNVADFLEEARRFGVSRRIPRSAPFDRLTPQSRLLLVHARAILGHDSVVAYRPRENAPYPCPMEVMQRLGGQGDPMERRHGLADLIDDVKVHAHRQGETLCAGLWWEDVTEGHPVAGATAVDQRIVERAMPSFSYQGLAGLPGTQYQPGFFASFSLGRLAVVRDPQGGTHQQAGELARHSQLPVEEVDE